jgi:hypothetical protein
MDRACGWFEETFLKKRTFVALAVQNAMTSQLPVLPSGTISSSHFRVQAHSHSMLSHHCDAVLALRNYKHPSDT